MSEVPSQPDRDTAFTAWWAGRLPSAHVALRDTLAGAAFAAGWDAATRAERERIAKGVREHMDQCPDGCMDLGWLDDILRGAINGAALLGGDTQPDTHQPR